MSQYYPNQIPPQNSQQQQQQLHPQQQQQQQPIPQQQQQPYYPTPQNYFHQGSNQQYPEGNAANVGGHQHYPGAPSSANQQPAQDHRQQPYSYQQQMHQQFSAQHQQFPYSAAANGGYAGSHPTPQSYHPQNHQQHQHYQQQQQQHQLQQQQQEQQRQQQQQQQQQQQAQHQQRNPSISLETQASTNEINWVPKGYDLNQLGMWFSNLDSENRGYIGGARAVSFLSGFNLSRDTLRLIWGLVDSQNTGCIDVKQFYKIIRMVAISCSPTYAGAAPSMETYYRTVEEVIPIPPLSNSIVMSGDTGSVAVSLPSEPVLLTAMPVNIPETLSIHKPTAENGWHNGYAPPDVTAQNHQVSSDGPISSALSSTQHQQMHVVAGVNHLNHMIPIQAEQKVDDDFEFSDFESATVPSVSVSPFEDFGLPAPVSTPALNLAPAPDSFASLSTSSLPIPVQMTDNLSDIISRPDSSDFGDFNEPSVPVVPSLLSISPSAVPSLPVPPAPVMLAPLLNNGAGASNSRISFFDDLIESDLQVAGAGEWEDFVEGTAAVPEMQVSTQEPEAAADAANPFDMFDTDDSPCDPESAAVNLGTGTGTESSDPISSVLKMSDVFNVGESSTEQISNGSDFMMTDIATAIEQTNSVKKASNFNMNDAFNDDSFVAYEENAFFGDTQSTSVISESIFQPSDSFSFPVMDTPKAPAVIPPIVQMTPIDFSAEFEDEDFGDFEEANFAETVSDGTVSIPAVAASSAFTADFSSAPISMDQSAGDSRFDSMNLLFMDEDVPLPTVSNTSSSSFLSTLSKSTPIPIPFLDVQFPVQRFPQDIASGNTTAEIFSPVPITYPPLAPAPTTPLSQPLSQPQQISELIPKKDIGVSYSNSNSSSKVRTDKYSSSEIDSMELLVGVLSNKNFFDEAFCCSQKVSLLKSIDQLNREKVAAIDDDDLEAAVTIKKKLVALKSSPALLEDETVWAAVASSSKQGESLSDLVELLQAVDPSKGPWGRGLLLSLQGASGDSNVAERVSKALSVKRSLRMAIAVGTTHSKFSQYWLLLLNHVSSAVQNTSNIIDAFNRLKVADKEAVLSCEKMKIFIAGSLQIAELGLWVSASCLESNEHQIVAERVVTQCHIFGKAAEAIWSSGAKGSVSQFSLPTVKALSQAAAEQAAFAGSKEVVYCYLTLRPLAATLRGSDVSEPICGAVRGKHKESGENFLKSALSIWSQEISTGLPECDGSF